MINHTKSFHPGMGHDRLLFLYDPFWRLLGGDRYHRPLVDYANIQPGQRVLEIGCGTGNLVLLIKRLHPTADVVGVDPDPRALDRARRKAQRMARAVQLDQGFAQELPYADASFDHVFSAFMLHHLDHDVQERSMREVLRVLKPGSSIRLVDIGGAKAPSGGFGTFIHQHHKRISSTTRDDVLGLMHRAGFADPTVLTHRSIRVFGTITYYQATAP